MDETWKYLICTSKVYLYSFVCIAFKIKTQVVFSFYEKFIKKMIKKKKKIDEINRKNRTLINRIACKTINLNFFWPSWFILKKKIMLLLFKNLSNTCLVPTIESIQGARIVVYSFVADDIGPNNTISGFNIWVNDSVIQYVKRRPEYGTSFFIAVAFILQPTTVHIIIFQWTVEMVKLFYTNII